MPVLANLKLVTSQKQRTISPIVQRRQKLIDKIDEQLKSCEAQKAGEVYAPKRMRTYTNKHTGERMTVEAVKRVKNWFFDQLDPLYVGRMFMEVNTQRNQVEIYYTSKPEYASETNPVVNGVPNKMISYRYDLECWNAPREVSSATFACESPIWTEVADSSIPNWINNEGSRTVVYARGLTDNYLVQKDQGFSFLTSNANPNGDIASTFRRDNIKMLPNYSGLLMVHRILPEVVNIGDDELPLYPSPGNIAIKIEGAGSVGAEPAATTLVQFEATMLLA